jgi:hypothetical protein
MRLCQLFFELGTHGLQDSRPERAQTNGHERVRQAGALHELTDAARASPPGYGREGDPPLNLSQAEKRKCEKFFKIINRLIIVIALFLLQYIIRPDLISGNNLLFPSRSTSSE